MTRDLIDTTEAIAELSRLLVSHENMQDVHREVVQVALCRSPGWAPPRSVSRGVGTLGRRSEDTAVSPAGRCAAPQSPRSAA